MSQTRYDYEALKAEYVTGPDISIRALARKHEIKSWSALQAQANKGKEQGLDWDSEKERYQRTLAEKTLQTVTTALATKKAQIIADALDVIHAAIFKMAGDMRDHWVADPQNPSARVFVPGIVITPDSLAKLLDRFLTLTGNPSTISENRNIGLDLTPDLPPDIAQLIAEVAGGRAANARPVGRSALPGAKSARPD